jgi:uroporphyrin-III C-methyltransferase
MQQPPQEQQHERRDEPGFVSIVGAGPGDPELITVKGLARLRAADVVAYDRLAAPELLESCRAAAELIYVGKHTRSYGSVVTGSGSGSGNASACQRDIEQLLIDRARRGLRVVRLKGGDPFVFGRGGEEVIALRDAGVAFEVIPGLTSATAVPACAGVPLTHRGVAASFAVVTGHGFAGVGAAGFETGEPEVDWSSLATAVDTLVVLMGVERLELIVDQLLRSGRPAGTPAMLVERGTTEAQRTLTGTLSSISALARCAHVQPPAILVVGEVVRLGGAVAGLDQPASAAAVP